MFETETILAEAEILTEGRGAIEAVRALPAGAQLRAAKTLLAGLRRQAQVPLDRPEFPAKRSRRAARPVMMLPSGLEALNRGPLGGGR